MERTASLIKGDKLVDVCWCEMDDFFFFRLHAEVFLSFHILFDAFDHEGITLNAVLREFDLRLL